MSWDTTSFAPFDVSNPEMRCLQVKNNSTGDLIYLGGHGVYRYENNITGITESERNSEILIYPNPVNDIIYISLNNFTREKTLLTLTDLFGKKLKEVELVSDKISLNLKEPNGIYLVTISTDTNIYTRKIIIQR